MASSPSAFLTAVALLFVVFRRAAPDGPRVAPRRCFAMRETQG